MQLHNLAALFDGRRRYQQAEPLYRQAMAEFERRFGPEDQEVAPVMNTSRCFAGRRAAS
jgi:hypothetical protein